MLAPVLVDLLVKMHAAAFLLDVPISDVCPTLAVRAWPHRALTQRPPPRRRRHNKKPSKKHPTHTKEQSQ
jgi:hypothetical protein